MVDSLHIAVKEGGCSVTGSLVATWELVLCMTGSALVVCSCIVAEASMVAVSIRMGLRSHRQYDLVGSEIVDTH